MKKFTLVFFTVLMILQYGCKKKSTSEINYKKEMIDFVIEIAEYARSQDSDFIIIPQNGLRLASSTYEWGGEPRYRYLNTINALAQENVFYGYTKDDTPTPVNETEYYRYFFNLGKKAGKEILVTDYVSTKSRMAKSYSKNDKRGYISFAASSRNLDRIPEYPDPVHNVNSNDIKSLSDAQNFLYLLNYVHFETKEMLLDSIAATNFDLLILDAFYHNKLFTHEDLNRLRIKANGGKRLVIGYMSIGEAEDYRYYWNDTWTPGNPEWLVAENENWSGNFKVRYWSEDWKPFIYGNDSSYTHKLLDAGFDGAYLDIVEGFYYFETQSPGL